MGGVQTKTRSWRMSSGATLAAKQFALAAELSRRSWSAEGKTDCENSSIYVNEQILRRNCLAAPSTTRPNGIEKRVAGSGAVDATTFPEFKLT